MRGGIGIAAGCVILYTLVAIASAQSSLSSTSKPPVSLSAKKLAFGKVPVGGRSSSQMVTLTNSGGVNLAAPSVSISGRGFMIEYYQCTGTIAASGGTCWVSVAFVPTKKGKFHGHLTFTEAGVKKPQKVKLTGIGEAATLLPGVNVVFLTSLTYDGSINGNDGLAGADEQCATLASSAHLPAGTYKAWLSTSTVDAVSRLGAARAFVRVDGAPIADQISDLTAGKILNPIDLDESGADIRQDEENFHVWTGSTNLGTSSPYGACTDWRSILGSDFGETGYFDGGPSVWSDNDESSQCNDGSQLHLYCFDTSHAEPLTYTPAMGRLAFVSKGLFDPSTGIATADSLCQSEASAAGLPNPTTFLALLSTSTASAASRFNMAMGSPPFIRPDGIKIADAPTIADGNALDSGIWQHADGTYFSEFDPSVWTGCAAPNATCTETCGDWTTESSMVTGVLGYPAETEPVWWDQFESLPCTSSEAVYCLQQ